MAVPLDDDDARGPVPASPIGFEGFEKRIEITFSESPPVIDDHGGYYGLRALTRAQIDSILETASCTIVSQLSNEHLDSYVLSESSLFVYPHRIILKTCGTTRLLLAVPRILDLASQLLLPVLSVKYSRGSFIFPEAQPAPHRCFMEEVSVLDAYFGGILPGGIAYVMGGPEPNRNWHVYHASTSSSVSQGHERSEVALEMCMTGLDGTRASVFFKDAPGGRSLSAKEMTSFSGISAIIPEMRICDFDFDPCGYSMNGVHGGALSTIHVTPEEGFSYASYEADGFNPAAVDYGSLVRRVLGCFGPSEFSVAVTIFGGRGRAGSWGELLDVGGRFIARDSVEQELPNGGLLVYQSFSAGVMSPKSTLCCWDGGEELEEEGGEDKVWF